MARTVSPEERAILALPDFQIYGRLLIEGQPLEDLLGLNPLLSAKVTSDLDQVVASATFTCGVGFGSSSLSPYLSTGIKGSDGGPLLMEDRAIAFQVQCVRPGQAPTAFGWRRVFEGAIDTVTVSPPDSTVTIQCRDAMSALLLTEIENIGTNDASEPMWGFIVEAGLIQAQIQFILDTAWQYSYGSPYPSAFAVVGTHTTSASRFTQERTNLLDAIRSLATGKSGADVRGKWDLPGYGQDSFVLALYLPDRASSGGPTYVTFFFTEHNGNDPVIQSVTSLTRSRIGIRNVAEITPADNVRTPVVAENLASIAVYGRRAEAVSEDKASHIDTPPEALTLGEIIVTDLGQAKAAIEVVTSYYPFLEINDLFVVEPSFTVAGRTWDVDGIAGADISSGAAVFSATHIELNYALGKGSTTLQGRLGGGAAQAAHWRQADAKDHPRVTYVGIDQAPTGPARERAIWLPIAPP